MLCGGILAAQCKLHWHTSTVLVRCGVLTELEIDAERQLLHGLASLQTDLYRRFLCCRSHLLAGNSQTHSQIDRFQVQLDRLLQTLFREQRLNEVHRTSYSLDPFIAYHLLSYPFKDDSAQDGYIRSLTCSDDCVQLVRLVDHADSSQRAVVVHRVPLEEVSLSTVLLAARECLARFA